MTAMTPLSQQIWDLKYRLKKDGGPVDATIEDTWQRVAAALAAPEDDADRWRQTFADALADFRFLPAGRILAGAGADRDVTLSNCFVMGTIPDDMGGIFDALKEAALTMQQGGGIGYDFSTLRPTGAPVKGVGADASGPLSFMDVWDAMCRTIMSAGHRRGAMMATMRCDHPDIEEFVRAKHEAGRLRMFNLSVLVSDPFLAAVKADAPWELVFGGVSFRTVPARELWEKIVRASYAYAEPGVIFIDRINARNNLRYCETISATNPCGEQPLPPYGACLLGSVNLARLVRRPFEDGAGIDTAELEQLSSTAVRMLDNAVGVSLYPLPQQRAEAMAKRRIGLGITGLADALIQCGARYDSQRGRDIAAGWMRTISRAGYLASADLAAEKGAFPLYQTEPYLASENLRAMDDDVRSAIAANGIRNALVTSVAPTGTISLLAGNVSSGLEPVFAFTYSRSVLLPDGTRREEEVTDYAVRQFRQLRGEDARLPSEFVSAQSLGPSDHIQMQAAIQQFVDSAVSKTINMPADISFESFRDAYMESYESGCKGCTTFRPNDVTGAVLTAPSKADRAEPELPLEAPRARTGTRAAMVAKGESGLDAGAVVYMTRPLDRPGELRGRTYKIHWPESDHAIYITINDILQDGRLRPFEVFINSKNMEHFAWTVALTRMISAVFRRGGDVSFVVEELKAVFDPRGGHWVGGRYVPSLLAAIGEAIEQHLISTGFLPAGESGGAEQNEAVALAAGDVPALAAGRSCPKCSMPSLIRQEGCDTCTSCGYSRCG